MFHGFHSSSTALCSAQSARDSLAGRAGAGGGWTGQDRLLSVDTAALGSQGHLFVEGLKAVGRKQKGKALIGNREQQNEIKNLIHYCNI